MIDKLIQNQNNKININTRLNLKYNRYELFV